MGRWHLFEFGDQDWLPAFLRHYATDFLQFLSNQTGMYQPIIPLLEEALRKSDTDTIIDLASGGGGGLLGINRALQPKIKGLRLVMTDYYPNIEAFEHARRQADNIVYEAAPVDARSVPSHLRGLRTQFLSFHHFRPHDARLILQNAVDAQSGIALFEAQERSLPSLLAMLFSPITLLLATPFIRPFRWGRVVFTYLIPLMPVLVLWDGLVSSLRTYSPREMQALIAEVRGHEQYEWQVGKIASGPAKLLYLIGTKRR